MGNATEQVTNPDNRTQEPGISLHKRSQSQTSKVPNGASNLDKGLFMDLNKGGMMNLKG